LKEIEMVWKNPRRRFLCGLALVGALAAADGAQASDPALKRCIAAQAEAMDLSGVVLLARGGDATTYVRGVRAGPGSPAITLNTRFNLGSVGKMFAGTAVAQLVEQGKVGLDDPIGRYVDGLAPETAVVTVSQLLSHRSGLGGDHGYMLDSDLQLRQEKPTFPPGTKFAYANQNFQLLGKLIERASGLSYDAYLQRYVFRPAAMRSTTAEPLPGADYAASMSRLAPGEDQKGPPPWGSPNAPLIPSNVLKGLSGPAGGYFSTAEDMHRFFVALTNGTLVRPETLREMLKPWSVARPAGDGKPEVDSGLGIGISSVSGHRSIGYAGGAPGVNTATDFFPDDDAAAIVLVNRDPPIAQTLYAKLAPTLFDPEELKRCIGGAHP
jgi:CubicO group peptidase (beta-lactamase class C family)